VRRGALDAVPEGIFDDALDLVVWGHEHDCRVAPEPVASKHYFVTQPGSTVATSLANGESREKHAALLQIQGKEFQLQQLPHRKVRPFVLDVLALLEAAADEAFEAAD
jgi:double-strand break repair protein MRE11